MKYYAKFQASLFNYTIKDIVKNYERTFNSVEEAFNWGKKCVKLYKAYERKINARTV